MTIEELKDRQKWTFEQKLDHTVGTIEHFYAQLNGRVFVSFSGGKDSTVLLDLTRRFVDKNCKAVFCNTGAEYPDVVRFVRQTDNVTIIKPQETFKHILETRGFPLISKEQARYIRQARHTKSDKLRTLRLGEMDKNKRFGIIAKKWRFLVKAPFDVSEECCEILKKRPFKKYCRETGTRPMIATTCDESMLRMEQYVSRGGCSTFEKNKEASYPLSIWTDADIYAYIDKFNIKLCDLYAKGFARTGCMSCGFGAHIDKNRFGLFFRTCPRIAKKILAYENHGITYKAALRSCGVLLPAELLDNEESAGNGKDDNEE